MNILRKNLLIFLCVSLFSSAILCMQEDQGESEKLLILYATWKDKKEVILEYVEKAKQSRQKNHTHHVLLSEYVFLCVKLFVNFCTTVHRPNAPIFPIQFHQ